MIVYFLEIKTYTPKLHSNKPPHYLLEKFELQLLVFLTKKKPKH